MRFDVISILPALFSAVTEHGVVGRAHGRGLWSLKTWSPRDFATDAYRTVDDRTYGGGPGMVMMPEPLRQTLQAIQADRSALAVPPAPVIHLSPQGKAIDQQTIRAWSQGNGLVLLAGRYEGVDQRFLDRFVDEERSIGDFVVSGGELPAMLLIDAVVRLLPGVLNDDGSAANDSFAQGLLDHPHYTRPEQFEGEAVPSVLLSGHHREIARWRRQQSLRATFEKRPELIETYRANGRLSAEDSAYLSSLNP